MNKAIVVSALIVMLSALAPYAITEFGVRYYAAQRKEMKDPWIVDGNLTLRWDIFPEPIIQFENCSGFIINRSSVVLDLNGHTVMIKSTGKAPGDDGVVVEGQHGVTIKNGNITGFQIGMYVRDSCEVNIINNTISEMAEIGISIERKTAPTCNITILNNTIFDIENQGIWLNSVNHVNVSDNIVSKCYSHSIMIYDSSNCTVSGNILSNNDPSGMYMDISGNNTIANNTLSQNSIGLALKDSDSNTICHNNFLDNSNQVEISGSTNTWNYSYPCGGNYWSNYNGEDRLSGMNRNLQGSDGIGDQPYVIDENNRDMYPLVNQWGTTLRVFDVTWNISQTGVHWKIICPVALFSNSSIRDFDFDKTLKRISFNTSNGTFCTVIVARELLEGAFNCSIDDRPTVSSLNWDKTHTFVGLTYGNNSRKVEITGERAFRIVGDLDGNGVVDIRDIFLAAINFGKKTD